MPAWDPACTWPPPGTALTAAEVQALNNGSLDAVGLMQAEGPLHLYMFSSSCAPGAGQWIARWYYTPDERIEWTGIYPSLTALTGTARAHHCTIWELPEWRTDGPILHYYPLRLDPVSRRDAAGAVQAALAEG